MEADGVGALGGCVPDVSGNVAARAHYAARTNEVECASIARSIGTAAPPLSDIASPRMCCGLCARAWAGGAGHAGRTCSALATGSG